MVKVVSPVLMMAVGFLVGFYEAYVVTVLWRWFVVPTFVVPELSLLATYGMLLLMNLVKNRFLMAETEAYRKDPRAYVVSNMMDVALRASFAWGVGALVHLAM
jgi:hypothetical protein